MTSPPALPTREVNCADLQPVVGAVIDDLVAEEIESLLSFMEALGSRVSRGCDLHGQLARLNILDAEGTPTLGGLLVLGSYPQEYFPGFYIAVRQMEGQPDDHFLNQSTLIGHCDGAMQHAIDSAVRRVAQALANSQRPGQPSIPRVALAALLAEAVIERNYGVLSYSEPIRVEIYDSCVQIRSPRMLGENAPELRNRALANLMKLTAEAAAFVWRESGNGESGPLQGRGADELRRANLRQPTVTNRDGATVTTLSREPLLRTETTDWVEALAIQDRDRQMVLGIVREHGSLSLDEACWILGSRRDEAVKAISLLEAGGYVNYFADSETVALAKEYGGRSRRDQAILNAVACGGSLAAREIAEATGIPLSGVRTILRQLVLDSLLEPTAPETSSRRKYRLPSHD